MKLAILLLPLTVSMCSAPETPAPIKVVEYRCPPVQRYSQAQQQAALAELQANEGKIPQVKEMLNDFNRLRKACQTLTQPAAPKPIVQAVIPH